MMRKMSHASRSAARQQINCNLSSHQQSTTETTQQTMYPYTALCNPDRQKAITF